MSERTAVFPKAGQSIGKKRGAKKTERKLAVCVATGVCFALLLGILFLLLCTVIGLKTEDPDRITPPLALVSFFLCALLCGHLAARLYGKNGLFCGMLAGLLFVALLILTVFMLGRALRFSLFAVCAPAAIVCAATAGACVKKEKRRKKRRF